MPWLQNYSTGDISKMRQISVTSNTGVTVADSGVKKGYGTVGLELTLLWRGFTQISSIINMAPNLSFL